MLHTMLFNLPKAVNVDEMLRPFGKSLRDTDTNGDIPNLFALNGNFYSYKARIDFARTDWEKMDVSGGYMGIDVQGGDWRGLAYFTALHWAENTKCNYGGDYYGILDFQTVVFRCGADKIYILKNVGFPIPTNMHELFLERPVEWVDSIQVG